MIGLHQPVQHVNFLLSLIGNFIIYFSQYNYKEYTILECSKTICRENVFSHISHNPKLNNLSWMVLIITLVSFVVFTKLLITCSESGGRNTHFVDRCLSSTFWVTNLVGLMNMILSSGYDQNNLNLAS